MRFDLLACLLAIAGLVNVPFARADATMNEWNQLILDQFLEKLTGSPFNTSRAIAGMHLAQWNTVKEILLQQDLTPDSPNLPISSLLPALQTGVAAAAKTVLVDGQFVPAGAMAAIEALYDSQVDLTLTAAINIGVTAGQDIIAMRANDGSTAPNPNSNGDNSTCGVWRSTPSEFAIAAFPQWRSVTPWAMEAPSQFRLPPPPDFQESSIYQEAYNEVMRLGRKVSAFRTEEETMTARFWMMNVQVYTNELVRELTVDYDLVKAARYFVTNAIAFADAAIAGWDTKYEYSFWRPITAIRLGNCMNDTAKFPMDETWEPLLETPAHPEYMAGHSTTSAACIEALRFLNGGDTIPAVTITSPMMPMMGGRTFTSLTAIANEITRSRVLGGAHFSFSTAAGQTLGRQLGANTVKVLGVGGCGAGMYAWGSACLPCQMDTYWPSELFTDSCTSCTTGFASPMGASACAPRLSIALRANGEEFEGEASEDDGMMMPMSAASASSASVSTAAARKGTTFLNRKGRGVIQLVQSNEQSVSSGDLAVVTLTLPRKVKFAGSGHTISSKTGKVKELRKPKVSGRTLTWEYAPLAAGEENVFTIKVRVHEQVSSWLTFQASTYYVTSDNTGCMSDMNGMDGMISMSYGLNARTFNVPVN
ncbi:pap2 superfamily protein [Nannochloropsis oceanica]